MIVDPNVDDVDQRIARLLRRHQSNSSEPHSLSPIRALLTALGSPQERVRAVHVAATSGKTSTCWILRSYLETFGVRTGLTVSPHITSPRERIQVDGAPVSLHVFGEVLDRVVAAVEEHQLSAPSYFELIVAMALVEFDRAMVDVAVLETDLGGLLDATNVVTGPEKICVIGRIGLDHTEILGDTLEQITSQKCGIIHPGNTVLALRQEPVVNDVIVAHAVRVGAPLTWVDEADAQWSSPSTGPEFQRGNIALAQAILLALHRHGWLRTRPNIASLPDAVFPPGRFEWLAVADRHILADGAHNPQKLTALLNSLPSGQIAVLAGFIRGPKAKLCTMLEILAHRTRRFAYFEFTADQDIRNRRSFSFEEVRTVSQTLGLSCVAVHSEDEGIDWLLGQDAEHPVVLGSLYLVANVRETLLTRSWSKSRILARQQTPLCDAQ